MDFVVPEWYSVVFLEGSGAFWCPFWCRFDTILVAFSEQVDFEKHVFRVHETILFEVWEGTILALFRYIFGCAF